jgi:hypothetical protein
MDRRHDLVARRLLAFEIGLHHLIVGLHDGLDQTGVCVVDEVGDIGRKLDLGAGLAPPVYS